MGSMASSEERLLVAVAGNGVVAGPVGGRKVEGESTTEDGGEGGVDDEDDESLCCWRC